MSFVLVGTFIIGAGAAYPEELPATRVEVQDFYMDKHEVTNLKFTEFVAAPVMLRWLRLYLRLKTIQIFLWSY
jgi:formylglycine-generating enzyme required for sulfatase activity